MNAYYNVRPRYSPGSPASVPAYVAAMVANDEKEAHEATLSGVYGEDAATKAKTDPLRGLAERVEERAGAWLVEDLITKERYVRPFPAPYGESAKRQALRLLRLRSKFHLPLESELPKEVAR
jgi:hypothetical protein